MITVLIYKPESKIKAQFDGPLSRHQANIDAYGSDYVGIEWINPDIRNKKAELIDGSWQLVDDIPKVIESKRIEKINDISSEKAKALSTGMSFPGEVHDGAQWFAQDLTVGFTGNDYRATRKIIDKFSIIGHAPTAMQTSRLLRGRDKFQLILSGKRRILFSTFTELQSFIDTWQDKINLADLIEDEKIQQVYEAQTIEDIDAIYPSAGWEELNG